MFKRTWYSVSYRAWSKDWLWLADKADASGERRLASTIRAGLNRNVNSWSFPYVNLRFRDGSVEKVERLIAEVEAENKNSSVITLDSRA